MARMQIAAEEGQFGPHLSLFAAIGRTHPQLLGKTLPLNGAGVCGAAHGYCCPANRSAWGAYAGSCPAGP